MSGYRRRFCFRPFAVRNRRKPHIREDSGFIIRQYKDMASTLVPLRRLLKRSLSGGTPISESTQAPLVKTRFFISLSN